MARYAEEEINELEAYFRTEGSGRILDIMQNCSDEEFVKYFGTIGTFFIGKMGTRAWLDVIASDGEGDVSKMPKELKVTILTQIPENGNSGHGASKKDSK